MRGVRVILPGLPRLSGPGISGPATAGTRQHRHEPVDERVPQRVSSRGLIRIEPYLPDLGILLLQFLDHVAQMLLALPEMIELDLLRIDFLADQLPRAVEHDGALRQRLERLLRDDSN